MLFFLDFLVTRFVRNIGSDPVLGDSCLGGFLRVDWDALKLTMEAWKAASSVRSWSLTLQI